MVTTLSVTLRLLFELKEKNNNLFSIILQINIKKNICIQFYLCFEKINKNLINFYDGPSKHIKNHQVF